LPLLQPAREPPRERQSCQPQQEQPADERDCQRLRLAFTGLRDRAEARIGLEQQRPPAWAADGQIDLEQLLEVALEVVLRPRQVRDLRVGPPRAQRGLLVLAERK